MTPPGTAGPSRIVSLLPAATEIIAALGALDRLVGVSHECDYPPAVKALPRLTASVIDADLDAASVDAAVTAASKRGDALFSLRAERIRELSPQLIVTQGLCDVCAVSEDDVRAVAASMPHPTQVLSLGASTLDEVLESIATVASAIGAPERGEALAGDLHARLAAIHDTLKAARAPRPRVAVIEWTDPLFAAGHWVPDMVRRAGGIDVLATSGDHSERVDARAVQLAGPDVILFAPCGYSVGRAREVGERVLATHEWAWAKGRSVWAIDGNGLTSRPGPRLCDGVMTLASIFNPSLFPPVGPERACPLAAAAIH